MDGGYPFSLTERWMVSRIFFCRGVRPLAVLLDCGAVLPPAAAAAIFANAFRLPPDLPCAAVAQCRRKDSHCHCQTLLFNFSGGCSVVPKLGQPHCFFKHLF